MFNLLFGSPSILTTQQAVQVSRYTSVRGLFQIQLYRHSRKQIYLTMRQQRNENLKLYQIINPCHRLGAN